MTNLVTKSSYVLETLGKRSTKVSWPVDLCSRLPLRFSYDLMSNRSILAARRFIANVPSVERPAPAKPERTRTRQLFAAQRRWHTRSQVRRGQDR